MWYLIVTARSLIWMLLTIFSMLTMLTALLSPSWLMAASEEVIVENETVRFTPSVGVYAKCSKPSVINQYPVCTLLSGRGLAADPNVFPNVWKASTVFLGLGLSIMLLTVCASLLSCCFQSIFKKSIFTLSGAAQTIAGICFIVAVTLHPMAWGGSRVRALCGRDAAPFYVGDCAVGVGLWLAVVGTAATFACACLSLPADKSTSSDLVQDKIYEGRTLICLA